MYEILRLVIKNNIFNMINKVINLIKLIKLIKLSLYKFIKTLY